MFVPVQLLRKWREQRPSKKGDLDECHGEVWKVYYKTEPASNFILAQQCVIVVGLL
jgi:hypothetical protein